MDRFSSKEPQSRSHYSLCFSLRTNSLGVSELCKKVDARASSIRRCGDSFSKYGTAQSPRASFRLQQRPERASHRRVYRVREKRSLDSRPTTSQKRRAIAGRDPGGAAVAVTRLGAVPLTLTQRSGRGLLPWPHLHARVKVFAVEHLVRRKAGLHLSSPTHAPKHHTVSTSPKAMHGKARLGRESGTTVSTTVTRKCKQADPRQGTQMGKSMRNKHK